MDAPRQDAWKDEEDLLLATTVISYIKEGKTQLEAFQEVANQLKRTPAACGFRWNATVRKQYQEEIQEAKQNRKQKRTFFATTATPEDPPMSLDAAISLLKEMKVKQYEDQGRQKLEYQLKKLNEDNRELRNQLKEMEAAWTEMDRLVHWVKERQKSLS
ncbi:RsfA family transcriptional regulator [Halobacillus locisalis]|uniref:RsfA family transcriptional regulator n=1 Tax=Halobacillus locisalis TaxID=220753 RepID=A0A838CQW8_9BACI|nr:RsfA family transcriptional regulator [Halobacillus locisalis]MBA2174278.1 RsfA family transcriptional regulator [Halobacillus locisalis]